MLLKIIGSIMVIASSGILGLALARDCIQRPQELRNLQSLFQMLENELYFLSSVIREAFYKLCDSGGSIKSSVFFKECADILTEKGVNAEKAWVEAVSGNISKTPLNKEDEKILLSFGSMLGSSDITGQVSNIRLIVEKLRLQELKAEEQRKKNENMFKSLGFLGGIAVVIVLF